MSPFLRLGLEGGEGVGFPEPTQQDAYSCRLLLMHRHSRAQKLYIRYVPNTTVCQDCLGFLQIDPFDTYHNISTSLNSPAVYFEASFAPVHQCRLARLIALPTRPKVEKVRITQWWKLNQNWEVTTLFFTLLGVKFVVVREWIVDWTLTLWDFRGWNQWRYSTTAVSVFLTGRYKTI